MYISQPGNESLLRFSKQVCLDQVALVHLDSWYFIDAMPINGATQPIRNDFQ